MNKLKVLACGSLLLCSGLMFAGCKEDPKNFKVDNITVGAESVVYNGEEQIFSVGYNGVDALVTYSLDNKETFVSAEDLNLKDAGTYVIYYKLSKEGFKDYVSDAQTFVINQKPITVTLSTISDFILNAKTAEQIANSVTLQYQNANDLVEGDTLNVSYEVADYNHSAPQVKSYTINGVDNDSNYAITFNAGSYKLTAGASVTTGTTTNYYQTFAEAFEQATDDSTIKLYENCELSSQLKIKNSITVDGQGLYSISAAENFSTENMEGKTSMVAVLADKEVTFKDVIINANNKTRAMCATAGKLVIDGATVTGGLSANYIGGVYITGDAEFEMTSGLITGNQNAEEYRTDNYKQYCADLWIGSQAQGKLSSIFGGKIGSVFVNANEYSTQNSGFELNGGTIENLYVEYANTKRANFKYTDGTLNNLYISTLHTAESAQVNPVKGTQYKGGVVATATVGNVDTLFELDDFTSGYIFTFLAQEQNQNAYVKTYVNQTHLSVVLPIAQVDEIVLINDINVETNLVINRKLTLNLNGKTISNTQDIYNLSNKVWSLISVQGGGDLSITGNGTLQAKENDCYAVDVRDGASLTIENGTFVGNISAVYVHTGSATINGGTFDVKQLSQFEDSRYTLNCLDANVGTTATIVVNGGKFANYNPAISNSENPATKFVADGKTTQASQADNNGDVWYTVIAE